MKLPIIRLLKTRAYRELATFQDAAVGMLYQTDSAVVLHGGTAVWRCYGGNRFSNDIDIYLESKEHMERIKVGIGQAAVDYGVSVEKVKDTGHLVFIGLSLGGMYLKIEINYWQTRIKPVAGRFEKVDGDYMEVRTLSPEGLILEKIAAYTDRRFIRDVYDIYILSDRVSEHGAIGKAVLEFVRDIKPPTNADVLRSLIYAGPIPSFDSMLKHIGGRFK